MTTLWHACAHILAEGCELAESLSSDFFRRTHPDCFDASIGTHLRHCAEHFDCFRRGIESGVIDYDRRRRGTIEESDPRAASRLLEDLATWFRERAAVGIEASAVRVRVDSGHGANEAISSVERELQFLVSHTVHHFAIIAIMCRKMGVGLSPEFGVAPSTLRYQEEEARV